MNNLKLFKHRWCKISELQKVKLWCVDWDNPDKLYVWLDNCLCDVDTSENSSSAVELKRLWFAEQDGYDPVAMEFINFTRQVCIAMSNGDLVLVYVDTNTMELGGACSDGLVGMAWSPDQEMVALVTATMNMVVMTGSLDPVAESMLSQQFFGEKQFITVGWGKKETQFHGSEGKAAAKAKPDDVLQQDHPDSGVTISWRGDGALFGVGYLGAEGRTFKIFNREGTLQYSAEKVAGLCSQLAWRPSGNLIASTQTLPNKYTVSFFEKNGLRHGDFTLPFTSAECKVLDLAWSYDSEILCVHVVYHSNATEKLLLYTSANYHWYLKQCLSFSAENGIPRAMWDAGIGRGKVLVILTTNGIFMNYRWEWAISHSIGTDISDNACISVIDGDAVLFTAFRGACIPPPMCAKSIKCSNQVNHIAFGPDNTLQKESDSNCFLTVLDDNSIEFYKPEFTNANVTDVTLIGSTRVDLADDFLNIPLNLHHWLWVNENFIICTLTDINRSKLVVINIVSYDKLVIKSIQSYDDIIISTEVVRNSTDVVLLQFQNGQIHKHNLISESTECLFELPTYCVKMQAIEIEAKLYVFSLTERNRFYLNDKEIANNVNSLFVHSEFLLMTTLQHSLLTVRLSRHGMDTLLNKMADSETNITTRKLERGSKLINAISKDSRTILQMPRGNLEVIQPRALSLHLISSFLENKEYRKAFELMRKQRINLNLIYDYNPDLFLNNIDRFLNEITNPSWLSLFLSELNEEDCTKTMYKSCFSDKTNNLIRNDVIEKLENLSLLEEKNMPEKIETICNQVRHYLEIREDSDVYLLPILTSFIKKNTVRDTELALLKIKGLIDREKHGGAFAISSNEALKYLLYLINVDRIYEIALGMYDFDLVLFVAQKSQKDPKEYLPFLNELRKLEENYRFYKIDKHLKRFQSALSHILKCDGEDRFVECLELIRGHALYKDALCLLAREDARYVKVAVAFGEYLMKKRKYNEAGIMFKRGGDLGNALESFKQALEWQQCMILAKTMKIEGREFSELCRELVVLLKDHRRFSEAALLLLYDLHDLEEAIGCLVQGRLWSDGLRLCRIQNRMDIVETHIRPGLSECITNLTNEAKSIEDQFSLHHSRLLVLNKQRAQRLTQYGGQGEGDGGGLIQDEDALAPDWDLYSDTSSVAGSHLTRSSRSSGTGRTFRSSKNRRKHERKLTSLKEGSTYERPALVTALHGLGVRAFVLRADVHEACKAALGLEWDERARALQTLLSSILLTIKAKFPDIWTPELIQAAILPTEATSNELASSVAQLINQDLNGVHLEQQFRYPPAVTNLEWELEILK